MNLTGSDPKTVRLSSESRSNLKPILSLGTSELVQGQPRLKVELTDGCEVFRVHILSGRWCAVDPLWRTEEVGASGGSGQQCRCPASPRPSPDSWAVLGLVVL